MKQGRLLLQQSPVGVMSDRVPDLSIITDKRTLRDRRLKKYGGVAARILIRIGYPGGVRSDSPPRRTSPYLIASLVSRVREVGRTALHHWHPNEKRFVNLESPALIVFYVWYIYKWVDFRHGYKISRRSIHFLRWIVKIYLLICSRG